MQKGLLRLLLTGVFGIAAIQMQAQTTISKFVASQNDDVEETVSGGSIDNTSSDLELTVDGSSNKIVGVRFTGLTIPVGATITNAYIQFTAKADKAPVSGAITIKAQNADNAATFTTTASDVSNRATTTASVNWPGSTASTWNTAGSRAADQRTPDLSSLVQAVVNRAGWASGNAIVFTFTGSGVRNSHSFDQSTASYRPELVITYTGGTPVITPIPVIAYPIPKLSQWAYNDSGYQLSSNWINPSYSHAGWKYGAGKLGYSDNAVTVLSYGPSSSDKYTTYYFRKQFTVASMASLTDSLQLNLLRDDGAIIYINGVEVLRSNMPSGAVNWFTTSSTIVDGADESTYYPYIISKNLLTAGTNTIAVEMHQRDSTSSDLGFDLELKNYTPPMPVITFPIPQGSQWYYLDNGTDQGTAWRASSFDNSGWAFGPAKLGYSDNAVTTVSYGPDANNKYITTYFRKQFNVPSIAALTSTLQLNVLRDDGFIIYINGTEVLRDNLPLTGVTYTTLAPNNTSGADELVYNEFTIPSSYLVNGVNTIAVELHQNAGNSSDLGFDLELKNGGGAITNTLSRGPYLQAGTTSSMNIRWRTLLAADSRVHYGTSANNLNMTATVVTSGTDHEVKITGLQPDTRYWYSIGSSDDTLQGDANNFFETLPVVGTKTLQRIGVIGDCGNNSTNQRNVRDQLSNYLGSNYMDSWILLGDNAYSSGTDAEFQAEFFNIYKDKFLKQNPLYPTPGNHDYNNGSSTAQNDHNVPYYDVFTMPTQGEAGGVASNNEAYYSFDIGNVHFLSLDSYGEENAGTTRLYDTNGTQVQWIKQDLAANTNKDWVVAYWHHPPFTKGSHNSDTETELVRIRENFIRILERNGVDLILCGHSHDYERSGLQKGHYGNETSFNAAVHNLSTGSGEYDGSANSCPYTKNTITGNQGTVYVVSGSAGQLGGTTSGYPHNAMQYSNATNGGSMILEVEDNRLTSKWICADGVIRDQFTIMKDVNKTDTTIVNLGDTVNLEATWVGAYIWNTGNITKTITYAPTNDTIIVVKDSTTNTCLQDNHYLKVQGCAAFTNVTANISAHASAQCATAINYTTLASGLPAPTYNYTFTGATIATGAGTGSGSIFNKGITNITVTATNSCGTVDTSFTITVADTTAPSITAPANVSVNTDANSCIATNVILGTPVFADNCGTPTVTNDAPATFNIGTTTITWTATDADGNATTSQQTVTVAAPTTSVVLAAPPACRYTELTITANTAYVGSNPQYQWYENNVAMAGETGATLTLDSMHQNYATSYYLVVSNIDLACVNSTFTSNMLNLQAVPLPQALVVTSGGLSLCDGNTVTLSLNNTNTDPLTYQWYNGNTAISGATNDNYTVSTAGSFILEVTSAVTGCTRLSAPRTVTVSESPVVNITANGPLAFCSGSTVTLNGTVTAGSTLRWLKNGANLSNTTNTFTTNAAGTYALKATLNGCPTTSAPIVVEGVRAVPNVTVTPSGTTMFCAGGTITLSAVTNADYTYQWYNGSNPLSGETASSFTTGTAGSYKVAVSNGGCTPKNSAVTKVTVNANPVAVITKTAQSASSATLRGNNGSGFSYQWYKDGSMLTGTTSQIITVNQNGSYTLELTRNGCTDTSDALNIMLANPSAKLSVETLAASMIEVYPNPSADVFCIGSQEQVNVIIKDVQGRIVADVKAATSIDLGKQAPGIYMMQIFSTDGNLLQVERLIKK